MAPRGRRPLIASAIAAVAIVAALGVRATGVTVAARQADEHTGPEARVADRVITSNHVPRAPAAREPSPETSDLLAWVEWKYRYLLEDAQLDPIARREVLQLLVERERLVRDLDAPGARARIDEVERRLRELLTPADRAHYEALRDSDAEQHHLSEYGGGIENLAPLGEDQRKALLAAKLRHKADFERDLREAGLDRPAMTAEERMRAHAIIDQAVDRYRDEFLGEISGVLDEQQFILLSNYEATELERTRAQLQIAINAR